MNKNPANAMTLSPTLSPAVRHTIFWVGLFFVALLLVRSLGQVLLPFVVGAVIAYFLNPACNALARRGMSRTLASLGVLALFILVLGGVLIITGPLISAQISGFFQQIPSYIDHLRAEIEPQIRSLIGMIPPEELSRARELSGQYAGKAAQIAATFLGGLWHGGTALLNIVSLIFIMPIVAYYILRDWPTIIATLDDSLPRAHAETIRAEVRKVDKTLAGFLRGQATVCMILGVYYATILTVLGVNFGLVIGLIGGVLSFMPFIGSAFVFVAAIAVALVQFDGYTIPATIAGLILAGQFVEGNFLTPKLVGESVGLHPLWVIFALMAGGSLFGFVGLLLAVPVAAVLGVLIRFAVARYRSSSYYAATNKRQTRPVKPL